MYIHYIRVKMHIDSDYIDATTATTHVICRPWRNCCLAGDGVVPRSPHGGGDAVSRCVRSPIFLCCVAPCRCQHDICRIYSATQYETVYTCVLMRFPASTLCVQAKRFRRNFHLAMQETKAKI